MPKIVDHDQYRRELLNQCFDLFAEQGYAALTMRQIAQALGVSTGTLYHYFSSKEDLFEQLVADMVEQDIYSFAAELEKLPTFGERLEAAFGFLERNEARCRQQTLISIEFYQQQGADKVQQNAALKQVSDHVEQALVDVLKLEDRRLIRLLMCFVDGLLMHRMFEGEAVSMTEQLALMRHVITTYLDHQQVRSQGDVG
ncbi:helix-turn-helix domain-containing protein [Thermosynechococcaceae cyanobacterium BACA0444]|uniref:Helix-turn-helix domain-containing protein n=1 Tax=Pseudocalidococcus azoricus BACA0444 TaxID=2918990 RepID=A0AAE4FR04_9CYAN|nr:helix-turn-helix domain-containing protein [Pseudocalidococcus azoricus]MDS3860673.1 helix-turn-helix domain-containing protein [Pseudocalidococcus azoricus BACA0444]